MNSYGAILTLRNNPRIRLRLAFERTLDPGIVRAVVTYAPPVDETDILSCIDRFKKEIPGGVYHIERRKDPEDDALKVAFYTLQPDRFIDMVEKHCLQAIDDRVKQAALALLPSHMS